MLKWSDITVGQFQEIEAINNSTMEDIDKVLFSACTVFGVTEYEMNNVSPKKAVKMINAVKRVFESELKTKPEANIGRYTAEYDVSRLSFGQYVEVSFFRSISQIHYLLASITKDKYGVNDSMRHREKADGFLLLPITKVLGSVNLFNENLEKFNAEYNTLFGLGDDYDPRITGHRFNKRYGWVYSASAIAEYERITLDEAYRLPVRQALNDLAYLKEKNNYEHFISKLK